MKIKTTFAVLLAAMVGFTSCQKDENGDGPGNGDTRSVFMKIEKDILESRAIEAPGTAATVEITQGILYFTDAQDIVKYRFTLNTTGPTDVNEAVPGTTIKISDLTAGLEIKKIDPVVKKAYLVANEDLIVGFVSPNVGQSITLLTGQALPLTTQGGVNGANLTDITLYGMGELVKRPAGSAEQFDVTIPLKPHVARIEIVDITGEDSPAPNVRELKEFNIKGVFVNNYYEEVTMGRGLVAGKLKHWGAGGTSVYGPTNGSYPAAMYEWSATNFNNTVTDMVKYGDGTDATSKQKVWAFNVFAPEGATVEFPHIILSISNVVTDPAKTYDEPSFVTVRSFKYDDAGPGASGAEAKLEAGKIYRLKAGYFKINPDNFYGSAELTSIDVKVNVQLLTWSIQGIKPEVD